jgi:hypothetical protein
MNKRVLVALASGVFCVSILAGGAAFAAHPLITDDSETQGKGNMQFEFIGEYGKDTEQGVTEKGFEGPTIPVFSYGISDATDIVIGLPYMSVRTEEAGTTSAVRGIGDASIEVKSRFYEKDGLGMAFKPGVSLPTGDEEEGLGNGKVSYSLFFITTKELEPWEFHFNAGYIRNQYKLRADEEANRKDIWHASVASEFEVVENLELVANIGIERNADKTSHTNPAFALAGFIYEVGENLDLDLGFKVGLNKAETDYSVLAGITLRL